MAQVIMKSELNLADFRKCGEISALLSENKPEFYLNCLFCDFTYLQLIDFVQHIYDDHLLEFPKKHIKHESMNTPVSSHLSLEYCSLDYFEVNPEYDMEEYAASEKSQDMDLLSNDETDTLDTNDAVNKENFSRDHKHEKNFLGDEVVDVEVTNSEGSQNIINSKVRRKKTQKDIGRESMGYVKIKQSSCDKNQNESKPVVKEIKITDTVLTVEQCIILAETYKEYTCLWDEKDIAYRFKNRRDEAFNAVREDYNKKTGLKLTEYEFEREVLRIRKICTYEKKQKIVCNKKKMEHKPSCTYYDYIEYLEVDVAPFVCAICEEQYPALGKLKVHVASHDGSLPFKCYICGHGFQLGCNLTTHLRRHAQDYTYYCEVCNKGWATSTDKKMHMRIHTGEKPYVCCICGSTFSTASRLAEHTRTNHKKRRCYKCEICLKAFYSSKVLNEHKKSHLKVRDHICGVCEKGFKSSKHLKQHKLIHDSEKRYVCKICLKRFSQSAGLCGHMKSHGAIATTIDTDNNLK